MAQPPPIRCASLDEIAHVERTRRDRGVLAPPMGSFLAYAQGAGALTSPTQISGCVAWFRADLGVTSSSGLVSQWNDQSGTGDANKNCTQSTGASKPTLNSSNASYNYKPTLDFDGTDDYMQSGTWVSALSQPFTDFVVGHSPAGASGSLALDTLSATQASLRIEGSTHPGIYAGTTTVDSTGVWTSAGAFCAIFNGGSSTLYFNSHTSTGSGNPGTNGRNGTTIGTYDGQLTGPYNWQGSIAEIITYNRVLSGSEITRVMKYLGTRYGITIS